MGRRCRPGLAPSRGSPGTSLHRARTGSERPGNGRTIRRVRVPSRAGVSRRLRRQWDAIDARLPHGRRTLTYHGFELVYSRRTSIVERLLATGTYEPEVTSAIVAALGGSEEPVFLDVGANIGLVSLMVLDCLPDARVYAFEPGRHQRELFAETIRRNGLAGRVVLSPLALSDSAGAATFAVHTTRHAAGDGFLDTGRGGPARFEAVEADTLDSWWRRNSAPRIDVLKLDTEGSELLVLRGAGETIARCRPTLVVEVHPQNVSAYPYVPEDVFRHIEGLGYALEELTSTEFVARPV